MDHQFQLFVFPSMAFGLVLGFCGLSQVLMTSWLVFIINIGLRCS